MAADPQWRESLHNLRRAELLELLGPPSDIYTSATTERLYYLLGSEPTGESVMLGIVIENDRVTDTIIHTW